MSSWSVPDPGAPPVGPVVTTLRPSWAWYLVAGLIGLGAVVAAIVIGVIGVVRFVDRIDDLQRVVMPGEATLELDRSGGYTIYYEYESELDGRAFATGEDPPSDLSLQLADPAGSPVPLETYGGSFSYADGDRAGSAQLTFEAEQPGAYVLRGTYPGEPSARPEIVLAVGGSLAGGLVGLGVLAVAVGGLGLVVAIVLVVVTAVRRGRAKRARRMPSGPGGAGAVPGAMPPGPLPQGPVPAAPPSPLPPPPPPPP